MKNNNIYKAKRIDNNEWVTGYYWTNGFNNHFIRVINKTFEILDFEINSETLCQSIGYQDSNHNIIFQNDIVSFYLRNDKIYDILIWWNNELQHMSAVDSEWAKFNNFDYFNFGNPNFKYEDFCLMLQDPWGDFNKIEIRGNIIDNPELFNVKNL